MAYQYRARRHPQLRLTITPEMEAQIERELAEAEKPRVNDAMVGLPTKLGPKTMGAKAKCGTAAGYASHRYYGEPQCQPCRDAVAARRRDRYPPPERVPAKHDKSKCGTTAGYSSHRRHGVPPCQACKDAVAAHLKAKYRAKRSARQGVRA